MTFQPFSPWMSPSSLTPSPRTDTIDTSQCKWNTGIENNATSRASVTPRLAPNDDVDSSAPFGYGSWRSPLANVQHNEVLPPKISGAFLPGLDVGPWSPPSAQSWQGRRQIESHHSLEDRLMAADAKIRQLTLDNRRLREYIVNNTVVPQLTIPPVLTPTSEVKSIFSGSTGPDADGADGIGMLANSYEDAPYTAPQFVIHNVLQGTFNFATMPPQLIRAIVWTLASCQPKNNHESAGLKTAVKALTARFGVSDGSDSSEVLVRSIIEWAKPLCYTSCGNYLCQQLLERGSIGDKQAFLEKVQADIVPIASNKFGTHVLCKAINLKELEEPVSEALFNHGVYESMQTGARRLWREYLEKCRQANKYDVFDRVNQEMTGRWADLACVNEHGSISVQQVFEVFGSQELMRPCFKEILDGIACIANNQYGHFVITKLVSYPSLYKLTCETILESYPPVATTHHGVNLAKIALTEGGRASFAKYVDAICRQSDGRTPGIVTIATSSIGKAHLTFVMSCLTPSEHVRVRSTCRAYCTTLRNCQSGNDLLRALGIMHSTSSKHRPSGGHNNII